MVYRFLLKSIKIKIIICNLLHRDNVKMATQSEAIIIRFLLLVQAHLTMD